MWIRFFGCIWNIMMFFIPFSQDDFYHLLFLSVPWCRSTEGQNHLSKKKKSNKNPGKVVIFHMFPPFFKGTFRWFFGSWDSLGHLKTLPDGILRCLPANCGRPGGFLGVIDLGEWWQFQILQRRETWTIPNLYLADTWDLPCRLSDGGDFFWGDHLQNDKAGDVLDLIFSGVDFRLDWHNSLGPQSFTACVDGRSWMSHFSNSWLKLLPSWHPLFHSGSVVPVWKLLRWGFKKMDLEKEIQGKKSRFSWKPGTKNPESNS